MKPISLRKSSRSRQNWMMAAGIILVPLLFIASYLFFIAQDRYVSRSVAVVKQIGEASGASAGGLGVLLGANNANVEDARYLKAYIESPDMLNHLDSLLDLRREFQGDGSDPIFQLSADASSEELFHYYLKRVSVTLDEKTHLLTMTTQGFDSDFTLRLNQAVLAESERFINEVSQRVAREQMRYAEVQLDDARERLSVAKEALIAYQNQTQMFDPMSNAQAINSLVTGFQAQLADLRTQERTLLSYLNPDAPQVVALRSQIVALQQQIDIEQAKLTSNSGMRLNRQAVQFQSLTSDADFAADLYRLSLGALEKSRLEAAQKLKNLVVIASPQLAQDSTYPRRSYILLSAFMILLLTYGFVLLTLSVIRDHRD